MLTLRHGDNRDVLKTLADNSIDSIVTDPPYALVSIVKRFGKPGSAPVVGGEEGNKNPFRGVSRGFMGKEWDTGEVAFAVEFWSECLRVLKPGGHVVAFSGTRTYHRMACAIEDAGFEIRDQLQWLYGTGFPKSHDVSKGIDRAAGVEREVTRAALVPDDFRPDHIDMDPRSSTARERRDTPATVSARQWQGWGTALKPANEPIVLARKPLSEKTVAANVLAHGTGAINVDGCRVGEREKPKVTDPKHGGHTHSCYGAPSGGGKLLPPGRWPANVLHDGSDEVMGAFPETTTGGRTYKGGEEEVSNWRATEGRTDPKVRSAYSRDGDSGSAARFFYSAKASKADRAGSKHPTVKPIKLMQWLCRLVTPPGGTVLDPFAGSGTTGAAALAEGFNVILIEREQEYVDDIRRRFDEGIENGTTRTTQEAARARTPRRQPDQASD